MLWTDPGDHVLVTPAGERLLAARAEFLSRRARQTFSGAEKERAYRTRAAEWEQCRTWRRQRNEARAALEARFGCDTRHAMHLVRLLRMCRAILTTGACTCRSSSGES